MAISSLKFIYQFSFNESTITENSAGMATKCNMLLNCACIVFFLNIHIKFI